jgi:hypothetical protein
VFTHVGVKNTRHPNGDVELDQHEYVKQLRLIDETGIKGLPDESSTTDTYGSLYRSLLGAIAWICQTRPDIYVFVVSLQRHNQAPQCIHIRRLNTLLRWIKRRNASLVYKCHAFNIITVKCISDAAFKGEDVTALAMRGGIVALGDWHENTMGGTIHILEFFSGRQKRVVRSTLGAETRSLADTVDIGKVIAVAMTELTGQGLTTMEARDVELHGFHLVKMEAATDARSLFDALQSEDSRTPTEVSMLFDLAALREALVVKRIHRIWWLDTHDMLADGLTKGVINRDALIATAMSGQWIVKDNAKAYVAPHRPLCED